MGDFHIYLLEKANIINMSYDDIKTLYIKIFNSTLMRMGYVDYTKVLNLKYGPTIVYTLKINSLIDLFFELLKDENVGINCLDDIKLQELISTFNVEINTVDTLNQSNELMRHLLTNWYEDNSSTFEYPISGIEYINKDSEDLSYIISSSYTVTQV